jgi:outer membrane protein
VALAGQVGKQNSVARLRPPQGFQQFIVGGKLQLSLADAIRLALESNTNVQIDATQIETAKYSIGFAQGTFDPQLTSNFTTLRSTSTTLQTQGLSVPSQLLQNYQLGVSKIFETGTSVQVSTSAQKSSSNSAPIPGSPNPAVFGNVTFSFTQPLLRGAWLLPNRGPILIARRNLEQSRATFRQEVSSALLNVVSQYWNVFQARESLVVQQKSLDMAKASYNHDKLALEKGALSPLDIYRSEAQVASVRVSEIQAEYTLKQAEDAFRRAIGADLDPNIQALDLNLTEPPEPTGELMNMDIATALAKAFANRPELEAQKLQLANDDLNVKIAHNGLEPNLSLTGMYEGNGQNTTQDGPFLEALNQAYGFGSPTYEAGLSLTFPIKNHTVEANLGNAEVSKRLDLYADRQLREQVNLDVANAVHQLDQSKLSMEAAKISLDLAQKSHQAEQRKYELEAETVFFVLQAQTQLSQAEESFIQAEVGYQLSVASVDYATGELLGSYGVQVAKLTK